MLRLAAEAVSSGAPWWFAGAAPAVMFFIGAWLGHWLTRSRERESREDRDRREWRNEGATLVANLKGMLLGIQPSSLRTIPNTDVRQHPLTTAYETWGRHKAHLYRVMAGHTDRRRVKPEALAVEEAMDALIDATMTAHLADRGRNRMAGEPPDIAEVLNALTRAEAAPRPSWFATATAESGPAWDHAEECWHDAQRALERLEMVNAGEKLR